MYNKRDKHVKNTTEFFAEKNCQKEKHHSSNHTTSSHISEKKNSLKTNTLRISVNSDKFIIIQINSFNIETCLQQETEAVSHMH